MNILRRLFLSPVDKSYIETHEMLLRCARRCAYDLRHAVEMLPDDHWFPEGVETLNRKAVHWTKLFSHGNAMKDYRLSLHDEIDVLEARIDKLNKLCIANGIDPYDGSEDIPF